MSVEAKVYSPKPPLTIEQFVSCFRTRGLEVRLLDGEGEIPPTPFAGPLCGDHVVIAWDARNADVTSAVDAAIAARDKGPIDKQASRDKLAWCEMHTQPFNYQEFWSEFPDELEEYEQSVKPSALERIKAAVTRYWFRSGTKPALCAQLVDGLSRVLAKEVAGVKE